jgi:hypothetical protein
MDRISIANSPGHQSRRLAEDCDSLYFDEDTLG